MPFPVVRAFLCGVLVLGACAPASAQIGSSAAAPSPVAATDAAPPWLDAYVRQVMDAFEVPGLALAIVRDGEVVVAKGYGVRELGGTTPVDARTGFGIASNTKAFTAAALGILVEEGVLEWDEPVVTYLPWFRMADPYVTEHLTIRDLLVHRSGLGLGAGDLLWWPPSTYEREEIARRLRHVPLETSFRGAYAYDNVLYSVAGEVIEEVTGRTWERFVTERILEPLGMTHTEPYHTALDRGGNVASPHAEIEGVVRVIDAFADDNTNPAGGIVTGAEDIAKWMIAQLDSGRVSESERLWSERTTRELWTMVTPVGIGNYPAELKPQQPQFNGYALGLFVRDYRGEKMLVHSGYVPGFITRVIMIPDLKLGVAVLPNHESRAMDPIAWRIVDYYMRAPEHDWLTAYRALDARSDSVAAAREAGQGAARDSLSAPSLPIGAYVGTYRDAWYGDVIVERDPRGGLDIRFAHSPSLVGDLVHWQHDTFKAVWHDRSLRADAYVTFWLGPDGEIEEVRMEPHSPAVDFSFDFQHLRLRPMDEGDG